MKSIQTLDEIQSYDWQVKIEKEKNKRSEILEAIDAIKQSIYIILSTPRGSIPHNPEFGSDIWKYMDHPTNKTLVNLIREAIKAIAIWETRVEIVTINAEIDVDQVLFKMTFKVKETEQENQIEVII